MHHVCCQGRSQIGCGKKQRDACAACGSREAAWHLRPKKISANHKGLRTASNAIVFRHMATISPRMVQMPAKRSDPDQGHKNDPRPGFPQSFQMIDKPGQSQFQATTVGSIAKVRTTWTHIMTARRESAPAGNIETVISSRHVTICGSSPKRPIRHANHPGPGMYLSLGFHTLAKTPPQ